MRCSPPTDQCQTTLPKARLAPVKVNSSIKVTIYTPGTILYGVEYPFGQFRSPVPPPGFFCVPPYWQSLRQNQRSLLNLR